MKSQKSFSAWGYAVLVISLLLSHTGNSAIISTCDQAGLEAALAAGGSYTFACDGTISLTNSLQVIKDVSLDAGNHHVTIDGNNTVRIFNVSTGVSLSLRYITLLNGNYTGTNGVFGSPFPPIVQSTAGESAQGGALFNDHGAVDLFGCLLSNNTVKGGIGANPGGGLKATAGGAGLGGAIYNLGGTLNVGYSRFINNRAAGAAGGGDGFTFGSVGDSKGGAICNVGGILNLTSNIFISNLSTGAVSYGSFGGPSGASGNAFGGAVHSAEGSLLIGGCTFSSNTAAGGPTVWSSSSVGKGYGGAISCSNTVFNCGGSIFNSNVAIGGFGMRHSKAADGKGGAFWCSGDGLMIECTFKGNVATTQASGDVGGQGQGGAICLEAGNLVLQYCLLHENSAKGGRGFGVGSPLASAGGGNGVGGAIYNAGGLFVTNSTFFLNIAAGGDGTTVPPGSAGGAGGGAIFNALGIATLMNVTLAKNAAAGSKAGNPGPTQGGNIHATNGTVTLYNTIIAGSTSGNNCFGTIMDGGYNLSSDLSCNFSSTGSLNNTDPLLGPLQDNGGHSLTLGLTDCSPALNSANPTNYALNDQRLSWSRPIGPRADMGACEGVFTWYHSDLSFTNQAVQLTAYGVPNETFILSTSTDLQNWTPILTNNLGGNCRYTYTTTNQPHAFYIINYR